MLLFDSLYHQDMEYIMCSIRSTFIRVLLHFLLTWSPDDNRVWSDIILGFFGIDALDLNNWSP